MSYATAFYNKMTIDPPLTWREIKESEAWEGHPRHRNGDTSIFAHRYGIRLEVREHEIETDEGVAIRRTCEEVEVVGDDLRAEDVLTQLRGLASLFGATHTFHGWFDVRGERDDDVSKVKIVGTEVVRERPVMLWPGALTAIDTIATTLLHAEGLSRPLGEPLAQRILKDLHDALSKGRS